MKKITAFECEFCKKILRTKQGMKVHEPKCFKNSESKSCITCKSLATESLVNKRTLTDKEDLILQYKVEGTYHTCTDENEVHHNVLNDEYAYLYDTESVSYCMSQKMRLIKLKTKCNYHTVS